jgi:hypothetical protein
MYILLMLLYNKATGYTAGREIVLVVIHLSHAFCFVSIACIRSIPYATVPPRQV